jgi:hypothetical protein
MKKLSTCLFGGALIAAGLTSPAIADSVLYDSGTATGDAGDGYAIFGYGGGVADFSLGSATSVTSFTLTILSLTGAPAASTDVDWAIYSRTGTLVASLESSGSATGLTGSNFVSTGSLFDVYDVTVSVGALSLAAGDYYLATQRANTDAYAFWAFTGAVDGDTSAIGNASTAFLQAGDLAATNILPGFGFGDVDYAFTINGNTVTVVPIPPAAFAGLGLLGCMGAYRRIRK